MQYGSNRRAEANRGRCKGGSEAPAPAAYFFDDFILCGTRARAGVSCLSIPTPGSRIFF